MDIDDFVLIYRGSEFHKLGAFTENALCPKDLRRVGSGTTSFTVGPLMTVMVLLFDRPAANHARNLAHLAHLVLDRSYVAGFPPGGVGPDLPHSAPKGGYTRLVDKKKHFS